MIRKALVGTLLTVVVLTMIANASTNSPGDGPKESVTFVYGDLVVRSTAKRVNIVVGTSDREKFLSDPTDALRQQGVVVPQPAETHWRALTVSLRRLANPHQAKPAGRNTKGKEQIYFTITLTNNPGVMLTIVSDGNSDGTAASPRSIDPTRFLSDPVATLRTLGVEVAVGDESAWRQFADSLKGLRNFPSFLKVKRDGEKSAEAADPDLPVIVGSVPNSENDAVAEKNQASSTGSGPIKFPKRIDSSAPSNKLPSAQPDLGISQFLFPPTNNKALRVHVVNTGQSVSGDCRLVLTVRKINGAAVGRTTHVNVPPLRAGGNVWLLINASDILPNSVSLESTTFKLNVDATGLIAESDESNNELWHNQ